jgi:hypothetical protein
MTRRRRRRKRRWMSRQQGRQQALGTRCRHRRQQHSSSRVVEVVAKQAQAKVVPAVAQDLLSAQQSLASQLG